MTEPTVGANPLDTYASATSRFVIEIVAWVAGPWWAFDMTGSWWIAVVSLVVLVALPAVFNVPGDKEFGGIAIPGVLRIAIELLLLTVAIAAAFAVWPTFVAVSVAVIGVVMLATGRPRYLGLLSSTDSTH